MIVSLIGYRGSGKTNVAQRLAERLGWVWADVDAVIERQSLLTVREIFEREGEAGFRRRERAMLETLLTQRRLVLATGGGAILNAQTRADLRTAGPVVWLEAAPEVLLSRIESDAQTQARRPNLLAGGLEEVRTILEARTPLYAECASMRIATDGHTLGDVVETILRQLPAEVQNRIHKY